MEIRRSKVRGATTSTKTISEKQTELEKKESIDMLRCLENGDKVKIVETDFPNWSVDTEDDLRIVSNMMLKDELFEKY